MGILDKIFKPAAADSTQMATSTQEKPSRKTKTTQTFKYDHKGDSEMGTSIERSTVTGNGVGANSNIVGTGNTINNYYGPAPTATATKQEVVAEIPVKSKEETKPKPTPEEVNPKKKEVPKKKNEDITPPPPPPEALPKSAREIIARAEQLASASTGPGTHEEEDFYNAVTEIPGGDTPESVVPGDVKTMDKRTWLPEADLKALDKELKSKQYAVFGFGTPGGLRKFIEGEFDPTNRGDFYDDKMRELVNLLDKYGIE